jgi:hypothetical protein
MVMRFHHSTFAWGPALSLIAAMVLSGCSGSTTYTYDGPTGQMKGKVTHKGQPVTEGQVVLISSQGSAVGDISTDGTYEMMYEGSPDIPAATYKAYISPPKTVSPTTADEDNPPTTVDNPQIPNKYQLAATSELTVTVKEGENSPLEIDMK